MMRYSCLIIAAASLAGCGHVAAVTDARRGLEPVHVPVVSHQDFVFDAAAPNGSLPSFESGRLDGWFQGLGLKYGDKVSVEGPGAPEARDDVARVAGRYGLLVGLGGVVPMGSLAPGSVRVVVSRVTASVPGCPDWSEKDSPNYNNHTPSNYGCAVNGNLAAMVANPEDLAYGRADKSTDDSFSATRAIAAYRSAPATGTKGLQDVTTSGKGK